MTPDAKIATNIADDSKTIGVKYLSTSAEFPERTEKMNLANNLSLELAHKYDTGFKIGLAILRIILYASTMTSMS